MHLGTRASWSKYCGAPTSKVTGIVEFQIPSLATFWRVNKMMEALLLSPHLPAILSFKWINNVILKKKVYFAAPVAVNTYRSQILISKCHYQGNHSLWPWLYNLLKIGKMKWRVYSNSLYCICNFAVYLNYCKLEYLKNNQQIYPALLLATSL